ncbi:unnamed protein product [Larinioides sclopetarius]|uniref:Uncharacterized protein n=1 Tax=Larinioides sclopetarius TaxID=280406 RepID=A0AAV1ZPD9_9ARAC
MSHWRKTISVHSMWKSICSKKILKTSSANSFRV